MAFLPSHAVGLVAPETINKRPLPSPDRCTSENEHPRKRAPDHTVLAYFDAEAKFSSQT